MSNGNYIDIVEQSKVTERLQGGWTEIPDLEALPDWETAEATAKQYINDFRFQAFWPVDGPPISEAANNEE